MNGRIVSVAMVLLLLFVTGTPMLSADVEAAEARSSTGTTLTYTGDATTVQLAGEWDWSERLTMTNNSGVWTVDVELPEGLYCYKFVVDGAFIFDPANPERVYCDDIENSLLRVRDHARPHYTANLAGDALSVTFHPGSSGAAHDGTPSSLTGAAWDEASSTWTLDLSGFGDGKHTLSIEGVDVEGNMAYDLLVPFWRGQHASFVWDDALIYMVMTDRFVNGNQSNDGNQTGADHGADWQGGDFAGVTQMIEAGYFAELGVNALWLTPFNTAATGTGVAADGVHDVSAFHGYWPTEARGVEPRLGTVDELHTMIETAHEHGLRVMMDLVVNHVHEDHEYFQNHSEWFNAGCICGQPGCDWTEHRLDCQFTAYMPDVNWKNRNASEQFIEDALWWLETFDLDGARIDAVKHVENLAVANLVAQINARFETVGTDMYLKGETAMGWAGHSLEANQAEYDAINAYMGSDGLDGQADFVLYHAVVDNVFVSGTENYQHLDYWTNRSQDQYLSDSLMVPYVGSHDVPRLTSRADTGTGDANNQWIEQGLPGQPGDISAYHAAMQAYGWLLTTPGAPLLYYGDEYGEYGGADPDNRHMYRDETQWSPHEANLFENISELGRLRLSSVALRQGEYSTRLAQANMLAYNMSHDEQTMTVVLNRGGPSQLAGFAGEDSVRFGAATLEGGVLNVPAHSVVVVELQASSNPSNGSSSPPVVGCTDSAALNYDAAATEDDGSCLYAAPSVPGCTDTTAENYDAAATEDDGSCTYPTEPVPGCMDASATNHDPQATEDDGSCTYDEPSTNSTNDETGNLSGDTTNNTNGSSTGNESEEPVEEDTANQTAPTVCEGCCGESFEVEPGEPCPVVDCGPCEEDEPSSSAAMLRAVLRGSVAVLILLVLLLRLKPPKPAFDDEKEFDHVQENFS